MDVCFTIWKVCNTTYTESPLLYENELLSLFIMAGLFNLKSYSNLGRYCNLLFSNI